MEEKISNFSRYLKKGKRCCGQASGKKPVTTGVRVQLRGDERKVRRRSNDGAKSNKKHVAPDTTAQIFWLKNRKPEQWRDKPQSESASDKALAKAIEILGGVDSAID